MRERGLASGANLNRGLAGGGLFGAGLEVECGGIYAVSQVRRGGAVVEEVAEMGVASAAEHFCSFHEKAVIRLCLDVFLGDRCIEARPAGSGVELGL